MDWTEVSYQVYCIPRYLRALTLDEKTPQSMEHRKDVKFDPHIKGALRTVGFPMAGLSTFIVLISIYRT